MFTILSKSRIMPLFFLVSAGSLFGMDTDIFNCRTNDPKRAMIFALKEDLVETVKSLLDDKAVCLEDVVATKYKLTPLLYAALIGATNSGRFLIERDADITAKNPFGFDVVDLAAANNRVAFLMMLRSKELCLDKRSCLWGCDYTPLRHSITYDAVEAVEFLLDQNVQHGPFDVHITKEGTGRSVVHELTLLAYAVQCNAKHTCELLLRKYGYNPDEKIEIFGESMTLIELANCLVPPRTEIKAMLMNNTMDISDDKESPLEGA